MPLTEKASQVSLTEYKYNPSKKRTATVTVGHVPYGTTLADLPAAIRMEPGESLSDELIMELAERLMMGPLRRDDAGALAKAIRALPRRLQDLGAGHQQEALAVLDAAMKDLKESCRRMNELRGAAALQGGDPAPTNADREAALARMRAHSAERQLMVHPMSGPRAVASPARMDPISSAALALATPAHGSASASAGVTPALPRADRQSAATVAEQRGASAADTKSTSTHASGTGVRGTLASVLKPRLGARLSEWLKRTVTMLLRRTQIERP